MSYGDGKARTRLPSAPPGVFTFLPYEGMPPCDNDTERAMRDGAMPQRNSRHKTMNAGGRKALSTLPAFVLACARQDVLPACPKPPVGQSRRTCTML